MRDDPVLIGPIGAGKTTVAALLARTLERPRRSLDDVCFAYYAEIGWDGESARRIAECDGGRALHAHLEIFQAHAVERFLADSARCVFELGAGHSVYDDPVSFHRVERALAPFEHVILLLPSPDPEESIRVLRERIGATRTEAALAMNEIFVTHRSNAALASYTIYTARRTPEQVCDAILARIVATREPSILG